MSFKEIVDSKTENVNSRKTTHPATSGTEAARSGGLKPTVAEMRESQAKGATGHGMADGPNKDPGCIEGQDDCSE